MADHTKPSLSIRYDTDEGILGVYVHAVFSACLGRVPDPIGFRTQVEALRSGAAWDELLRWIVDSPEFREVFLDREGIKEMHRARATIFRERIPAARRILDLGGAATDAPDGSLFAMGYPHCPERLTIVDLPVDIRFNESHRAEKRHILTANRGTSIEYVYRSMGALDFVQDNSIDLVVSGQSIEHVHEDEADRVIAHAHRVLVRGGHFCLDTPNALVTRLISDSLIHPDHKKEYEPREIRAKLEARGFEIIDALGICPMPRSLKEGRFYKEEQLMGGTLSERPEECFLFYFCARKP